MDTFGPTKSVLIIKVPDYQGVLIFQVSLYDKVPIETMTKYVDIFFKYSDQQVSL